jgi:hypothetical protein
MSFSVRRLISIVRGGCALGLAGAALSAPTAHASLINLSDCTTSALSQPFAPWGDRSDYELAPGGDFESSTWTLRGGARLVSGSDPFAATGTLGSWSLSLPAGSSAQSPLTCVDAAYPSTRMFTGGTGTVAVEIVYDDLPIPAGVTVADGTWRPTPGMITAAAVWGALSGGTAEVSLRLTALTGTPQLDDVFIDPWNRG